MDRLSKINIAGFNIISLPKDEILKYLEECVSGNKPVTVCHINAHILVLAVKDREFSETLKKFDVILPDGAGIYLASKLLYGNSGISERITGTDLYPDILRLASEHGKSVFFIGSEEKMHAQLAETLNKDYGNIKISGSISRAESLAKESINKVISASPDIVFIGTGSPFQEQYIADNIAALKSSLSVAVGSGLEYYCGYRRRAPAILRSLGLEWLYRLFQEPSRLWKRYILGIPLFIFYVVRFKFKFTENA